MLWAESIYSATNELLLVIVRHKVGFWTVFSAVKMTFRPMSVKVCIQDRCFSEQKGLKSGDCFVNLVNLWSKNDRLA